MYIVSVRSTLIKYDIRIPTRVLPPNINFTVLVYGWTKSPLRIYYYAVNVFPGITTPIETSHKYGNANYSLRIYNRQMIGICALSHTRAQTRNFPTSYKMKFCDNRDIILTEIVIIRSLG